MTPRKYCAQHGFVEQASYPLASEGETGDRGGKRIGSAEQYRHLDHHDTLTGLSNRRLLADRTEKAMARSSDARVALVLLDLDDLKKINDAQEHSVGDEVLVSVAQRLNHVVRESDTAARLGGDEFVVLVSFPVTWCIAC